MRIGLGLLLFAATFSFGQETASPDGPALLAGSEAALLGHRSYQYSEDVTVQIKMPGPPQPEMRFTGTVQAVNPAGANSARANSARMRLEFKVGDEAGILVVSDGSTTWMYMPLFQQFTRTPQRPGGFESLTDVIGLPGVPDAAKETANAKVIRSERIYIDGQTHDCWVVENRMGKFALPEQPGAEIQEPVFTYWIDKNLGLALETSMSMEVQTAGSEKPIETRMQTVTHSIKFDLDLPDSLFVFTPPSGARETAELFPGMRRITGNRPSPAATPNPGATPAPTAPPK